MKHITINSMLFNGPYQLNFDNIDFWIPFTSYGVYILGRKSWFVDFKPCYVGRSDTDLADRLKDHIGKYPLFCFKELSSKKEAFEYECSLFHELGKIWNLANDKHPDSPDYMNLECPYCQKQNNLKNIGKFFRLGGNRVCYF